MKTKNSLLFPFAVRFLTEAAVFVVLLSLLALTFALGRYVQPESAHPGPFPGLSWPQLGVRLFQLYAVCRIGEGLGACCARAYRLVCPPRVSRPTH